MRRGSLEQLDIRNQLLVICSFCFSRLEHFLHYGYHGHTSEQYSKLTTQIAFQKISLVSSLESSTIHIYKKAGTCAPFLFHFAP